MTTLEALGISDIERALVAFRDGLVLHKDAINALNVYPVPDGDTGTNMSLTLKSVVEEIEGATDDAEAKWRAIRHGSLMGARGNSGVILSQILRALSDSLAAAGPITPGVLANALTEASTSAYGAVPKPVEGTILTVIRESAEGACAALTDEISMVELLEATAAAGRLSLALTPDLLPVLKDAGVVDAGGAGLLLLIDALLHVVDGRDLPPAPQIDRAILDAPGVPRPDSHEPSVADLRYEVMFFLEAPDESIDAFKVAWTEIGDSIVVVGGDGLWNCHIHSNDVGACIEAGTDAGRPKQIRVTDLFEEIEHLEELMHPDGDAEAMVTVTNPEPATTAVVAVAVGHGVQQIFESLGVHAVIRGGQSMNPSTRQLVQAVQQVDADQVVILPNNKNIIPVAEQVDGEVDKRVVVVGTRGIAEGFASLLAYDPGADAVANQATMAEAAEAVVAGEVTCAVRESDTDAGRVAPGDWIGLDRSGVRSIGDSMTAAATALLDALVTDDHELVTIIAGDEATQESNQSIADWLEVNHPGVEAEIHSGGQPLYPYYFGVE